MSDLEVVQSPMFHTTPGRYAILPGCAPDRLLYDGAFSHSFQAAGESLLALAWLAVLALIVYSVLQRAVGTAWQSPDTVCGQIPMGGMVGSAEDMSAMRTERR